MYSEYKTQKLNLALWVDWLSLEVFVYIFSWMSLKESVFQVNRSSTVISGSTVSTGQTLSFSSLWDDDQACLSPEQSSVAPLHCGERVLWNVWAMSWLLRDLGRVDALLVESRPILLLPSWLRWSHMEQIVSVVIASSLCPYKHPCFLMPILSLGLAPTSFNDVQLFWAKEEWLKASFCAASEPESL